MQNSALTVIISKTVFYFIIFFIFVWSFLSGHSLYFTCASPCICHLSHMLPLQEASSQDWLSGKLPLGLTLGSHGLTFTYLPGALSGCGRFTFCLCLLHSDCLSVVVVVLDCRDWIGTFWKLTWSVLMDLVIGFPHWSVLIIEWCLRSVLFLAGCLSLCSLHSDHCHFFIRAVPPSCLQHQPLTSLHPAVSSPPEKHLPWELLHRESRTHRAE